VTDKSFKIGPESAGALPGPVCFGRGGEQPTLTDAALVAGFIDAKTFAGGQFALNPELADAAIARKIAEPLGLKGASGGASAMIETFAERLADEIGAMIKNAGWEPSQTTLLLYGGSGPLLATIVGQRLGVAEIMIPHAAASFSALGVAFCELAHGYRAIMPADVTQETLDEEVLPELERRAKRDMFGEGVAEADCETQLRLWQGAELKETHGAGALKINRGGAKGPVVVELRLSKRGSGLQAFPAGHQAPRQSALQTKRQVLLKGEPHSVPVVDAAAITPGTGGEGPCVIEAGYWGSVIMPKWKWSMAEWGFRIFK
jgi:N-methylhydantoinase A/oxoprolinase/acetone carboxylase beta subunit